MSDEKNDLRNLCTRVVERSLHAALDPANGSVDMLTFVQAAERAQALLSELDRHDCKVLVKAGLLEPLPPLGYRPTDKARTRASEQDNGND